MKARLFLIAALLWASPAGEVFACATCMGDKNSPATAHMAIAIWVMLAAIMSVLGGVGAFSFHLWRHATTPLEPHQQLITEDLDRYD
ncbi:MAG: hypothetical protein ABI217_11125 [Chthoniobacterales bacterium]